MKSKLIPIASALAFVLVAVLLVGIPKVEANAPNIAARIATTSTAVVGPASITTLFSDTATSSITSLCASRIISTTGTAIMLSFDANTVPSATVGFNQAASTTVAYSADLYGCGPVSAYGFASTTITKSEARW